MMTLPHLSSLRRAWTALLAPLLLAGLAGLAGCGGSAGSGDAAVTNISATGVAFSRTLTVTVNGSGLDDPGIFMTVEGPCTAPSRSGSALNYQLQFVCTVNGVGDLSPRIRKSNGDELGRLNLHVALPQVAIAVSQGTQSGTMVVELDPRVAPVTVANFMLYVNSGFYTSTLFHRVVAGVLAQGGGYTTGPTYKAPTYSAIVLESNNGLKNVRGTIAMARTSTADSAQSQFFFNIVDNSGFDYVSAEQPGYAVFGHIVSGLDVLDAIGRVATYSYDDTSEALQNLPLVDVVITAALQTR